MYLDQPQHHVHELLNETLWPDQPLGRPLTGTGKTLDAMQRAHFLDYLRRNYVTGGTLVVAAGKLQHPEIVRAVTRYAARFTPGKRPTFHAAESNQQKPRLRLFTKRTAQTQLALGIRTCSRHDERRFALRLLNTILGETQVRGSFRKSAKNAGSLIAFIVRLASSMTPATWSFPPASTPTNSRKH